MRFWAHVRLQSGSHGGMPRTTGPVMLHPVESIKGDTAEQSLPARAVTRLIARSTGYSREKCRCKLLLQDLHALYGLETLPLLKRSMAW